jgi:hypothetical protein
MYVGDEIIAVWASASVFLFRAPAAAIPAVIAREFSAPPSSDSVGARPAPPWQQA